ncbi:S8 family serine peptidase [Luteibacter sp. 329MFSha]|uniref:S8 family serine peptidase n=1 Tax=Luteibacter sp. 329MFSha TaxID=1798239 RepID=UPI0008C3CB55|nr:S8 family serine peptidase [Luteibacter sp. 329MFSha]SEV90850.1 serine protease [Luteibacter sp. 329MFSha]
MPRLSLRLIGVLAVATAVPAFAAQPASHPLRTIDVATTTQPSFDRFIVAYRNDGDALAATQTASVALSRMTFASAKGARLAPPTVTHLRKLAIGSRVLKLSRKLDANETAAFLARMAADPAVKSIVPDRMRQAVRDFRADDVVTPDDEYYAKDQWHLRAPDGTPDTDLAVPNQGGANLPGAWSLADGDGITVAVVDTGITQHPDLDTSLADAGYDFITDAFVSGRASDGRAPGGWDTGDWTTEAPWSDSCQPEPSSWHGTHVAGTVAELTNNGLGMAGVASHAKVLPVRVLGHCGGYDSDIADGIVWAAGGHVDGVPDNTHPAQVINMSLGGQGQCVPDDPMAQAIAAANARGAVVVVAAGNSGDDSAYYSPASCPGAITVASVGITSRLAFYSNYGKPVAIAGPGGGIYANDGTSGSPVTSGFVYQAINGGETVPAEPTYGGYAGTSQATPHVAGTVALMQSARLAAGQPLMTPAAVVSALKQTAHKPKVPFPTATPAGAGIVDATAAVKLALLGDNYTPELTNGSLLTNVASYAGTSLYYQIDVPAGAKSLVLRTFGGSGDVTLQVKVGARPADGAYDYVSAHAGNAESVVLARPAAGTYFLRVLGVKDALNLSVQASFVAP